MQFVNLTPHKIVYDDGDKRVEFEPSGEILRLEYKTYAKVDKVLLDGLQIFNYDQNQELTDKCYAEVDKYIRTAFIDRVQTTCYIVSNPVAKFIKDSLFIAPDTNPEYALRDTFGNIVGVKRFCRYG